VLARRALAAGVRAAHITVSEHCTRCTSSNLFSHRAGDRGRQVGYLGVRV
jgi:copper oxidase (laccase) domain-containing protein